MGHGDSATVERRQTDVLVETDSITNSISSVASVVSNQFESLVKDTGTVTTTITDDTDVVKVTLTASGSASEDGGVITYTATLSNSSGLPVNNHGGVTVTLANGETITIASNATSGTATATVGRDDVLVETDSITNSIGNWRTGNTSFTYAATDNEGNVDASPATISIGVTAGIDLPTTNDQSVSGTEDGGAIAITLSGDVDGTVASLRLAACLRTARCCMPATR